MADPIRRYAVLLGKGGCDDERLGLSTLDGPMPEYLSLADAIDADITSYRSAAARRGSLFAKAFARYPIIGSALDFAARAGRYDACYATGEDVGLPAAAALKARGWSGRLVMVVHNVTPKKIKLFRLIGHRRFDALIVLNQDQRARLIDECAIPDDKIFFLNQWVDDRFFSPPQTPSANEPPVVMACGAENRDYPTLLAAAASVSASFQVFAHGFFGDNIGRDDRPVPANVVQMPRVSFDALRRSYQQCDVVALPVNDVDYAAGVTGLVEAMACGRPLVVTRSEGLRDYLRMIDPESIVPAGDPVAMATAISRLLAKSREERAHIGNGYRQWVAENCSVHKYPALVKDIMDGK